MSVSARQFAASMSGWVIVIAAICLWGDLPSLAHAQDAAAAAPAAAAPAAAPQSTLMWLIHTSGWIGGVLLLMSFYFVALVVRLFQEGADAVISVRDQGQGIPAAELAKLFKPFQKTSVRSTAGEQSTGLGLAIVRKIVAGHGGRVSVESEVGHGSTFSFTLPLSSHAT